MSESGGLNKNWSWPDGACAAVSLTFDVDAEAPHLGRGEKYRRYLSTLSDARVGVARGMPKILALLSQHGLPATFFVPGETARRHQLLARWVTEYREARMEGRHVNFTMHPEVIGRASRFVALRQLVKIIVADPGVWFAKMEDVAKHAARVLAQLGALLAAALPDDDSPGRP